ncbi:hypothetical protein MRX96_008852 [Rhipicephalus microplus]
MVDLSIAQLSFRLQRACRRQHSSALEKAVECSTLSTQSPRSSAYHLEAVRFSRRKSRGTGVLGLTVHWIEAGLAKAAIDSRKLSSLSSPQSLLNLTQSTTM